MRDAPASVDTMLTGDRFTLATCVKFGLRGGVELGFTDLDEGFNFLLGGDVNSNVFYSSEQGMVIGDIVQGVGLDSGNFEIQIPIGGEVTAEAVYGRRFNKADVWVFDVDHQNITDERVEVTKGWVADARVHQNKAVFEVRTLTDAYNIVIGRVASPRCSADFGDTQCGVAKNWIDATVTLVEDSVKFYIDLAGLYDNGAFRFGEVDFVTGELADAWEFEVYNYTGNSGLVELFVPAPVAPTVGDTLRIAAGCSRLKTATDPLTPTCQSYDNVTRFRGFDRIPGTDSYARINTPSAS